MNQDQNKVKLICPLLGEDRECIMSKQINQEIPFPPPNRCVFYNLDRAHWENMVKYPERRESFITDCKFFNI